ncbi:unnamed protein product [Mytilus edulis]|uniref:Uncharacterized protein n=1 Tax=Mytilus edulis TaxID=6550 RepID=A0A8S3UHB1_MYTED|nr:unnamed protein product [Mytilus edulis]
MESKLKAVRAGHKSAVTRLLRKTEEEQDLEIEESTELLETLSQKQKIISALNEEILNLTKDEDVEDEILQTDEYKFFLNTKIRHIRKKYSNSPTSNITTLPNLSNQSTENTNQHSSVENTYSSVQQQIICRLKILQSITCVKMNILCRLTIIMGYDNSILTHLNRKL